MLRCPLTRRGSPSSERRTKATCSIKRNFNRPNTDRQEQEAIDTPLIKPLALTEERMLGLTTDTSSSTPDQIERDFNVF